MTETTETTKKTATKKTTTKKTATKKAPARKAAAKAPTRKAPKLTEAERASLKKAEEEKRKVEKAAKLREQQEARQAEKDKAEKSLIPIAKEINVRLGKANDIEKKADDHRLAAAIKLAEAKEKAKEASIPFKKWFEENITADFGFENARKLAAVGSADDPKQALEDMRSGEKSRKAEARKAGGDKPEKAEKAEKDEPKGATNFERAEKAIASLDEKSVRQVATRLADEMGMTMVPATDSNAMSPMSAAKEMYEALDPGQKGEFLVWAAEELGATIDLPS